MPLNADTIAIIADELCRRIVNLRIDKIQQPERDMLILTFNGKHSTQPQRLLICVKISDIRVHLTEHTFENPASAPMFCMLLRKHLSNARMDAVLQQPSERILELKFTASNVMGDKVEKSLVLELFGRIPNILLLDNEGVIIDCLRRVSGDMSGKRMLLPGLRYCYPDPIVQNTAPGKNEKIEFETGISISRQLDEAFTAKANEENMHRRGSELIRIMKTTQKRILRKLEAQQKELEETSQRDYQRECADIIMSNMHNIKKGDTLLIAEDFYAAGDTGSATGGAAKREIILDPLLSPQNNAAKYYKSYTKARNAVEHLKIQISQGRQELEYIESVLQQLSRAENIQELTEIKAELEQTGYIKPKLEKNNKGKNKSKSTIKNSSKSKKQAGKKIESNHLKFYSHSGMQILVGKTNNQNDILTFKIATKTDIWLHVQKLPGAHVIIKTEGKSVDDDTLKKAASAAAYYSSARDEARVSVDYTLVKYVKKPPGARPGMVIYTDFKTLTVKPESVI